ncbi:hypothetical protein C8J57DRAFT_1240000 [Mycena rebaudengoi]|nr:hypothetical protein C8J57DRAFT_1240000 [Mycena rebaudengoi]
MWCLLKITTLFALCATTGSTVGPFKTVQGDQGKEEQEKIQAHDVAGLPLTKADPAPPPIFIAAPSPVPPPEPTAPPKSSESESDPLSLLAQLEAAIKTLPATVYGKCRSRKPPQYCDGGEWGWMGFSTAPPEQILLPKVNSDVAMMLIWWNSVVVNINGRHAIKCNRNQETQKLSDRT